MKPTNGECDEKVGFGVSLPPQSKQGLEGGGHLANLAAMLEAAEGRFDSAWLADHVHPPIPGSDGRESVLECFTALAHFSARFPSLLFGSFVACQSFRNPALLAKIGATQQHLSGGRFVLGLGAGWKEGEYLAYGYDFPRPAVRIGQLSEAVQLIRQLWTESPANFEGRYYQVREAFCEPRPIPPPPIMIGGRGEKLLLRLVAQHADWWNSTESLEAYRHKLDVLRGHCAAVGRDYEAIGKSWWRGVAIANSETEAQQIADASGILPGRILVGTPEQVAKQIEPFLELGVRHVMMAFVDFPSTAGLRLFASDVIPRLR